MGAFPEVLAKSDCVLLLGKKLDFTLKFGQFSSFAKDLEIGTIFLPEKYYAFVPENGAPEYSLDHFLKIHLFRSVNRLMINTFSQDALAKQNFSGLSKTEFNVFVQTTFPIFESLKFFSTSLKETMPNRFLDANLFLPSSNGDNFLNMAEGIELETVLLSTQQRAKELHPLLAQACGAELKDDLGYYLIDRTCLRAALGYPESFTFHRARKDEKFEAAKRAVSESEFWNATPGFKSAYLEMKPKMRGTMLSYLDAISRHGEAAKPYHSMEDTQVYVLVPYYIDLVMSKFDKNKDGFIDNHEAKLAYPVFQPFVAEAAKKFNRTKPEEQYAIYIFLLSTGNLPIQEDPDAGWFEATMSKITQGSWWLLHWKELSKKEFKSDRAQLLKVFALLSSMQDSKK